MKYLKFFGFLGACILMTSCAQSLSVSKKETFEQKSGVIGVFRQPVGFCSGGYQQQIMLGGEKVIVKHDLLLVTAAAETDGLAENADDA